MDLYSFLPDSLAYCSLIYPALSLQLSCLFGIIYNTIFCFIYIGRRHYNNHDKRRFSGKRCRSRACMVSSKNRLSALVMASIISGFLLIIGFVLFIIPGLILALFFYFLAQAIILDATSSLKAFTASYKFVLERTL